ncbi:fibrobacter succinogenes major paralogous domain-containing protein [Flavobacteriales bacterium]|nr:fibrobacter succinogenes major paralogous domain-containing protein [Flavobacteriales bacterium]
MKHFIALTLCVLTSVRVLLCQVDCELDYDGNADGIVDVYDVLGVLEEFGLDCGDTESACQGQTAIDYNGENYELIEIEEQCWFSQNLKTSNYTNGDTIISGLNNQEWVEIGEGAMFSYSENFGNDPTEACMVQFEIGHLYNGYAALDERGLCPSGFRVATVPDWEVLIQNSGGDFLAGHNLKASPEDSIPWNGTNLYGFSALFGHFRSGSTGNNNCSSAYPRGFYWTSTETGFNQMQYYLFWEELFTVESDDTEKSVGYAVRCVKE